MGVPSTPPHFTFFACLVSLPHTRPTARIRIGAVIGLALSAVMLSRAGEGGQRAASPRSQPAPAAAAPFAVDGPPPPEPPAVLARDESGRATVRAVRIATPLRIDGILDEAVYSAVPPLSDFIQAEPHEGEQATEKTDGWLFFDQENVYVTFRCWESHPERRVANEMRRDNPIIFRTSTDAVAFMLDTFHDRRSGVIFNINPIGGRADGQFPNDRQYNGDWNPVWDLKVGRFEHGWTVEAAVPFKSLRYSSGSAQIWGFQMRRTSAWNNEISYLTRVPPGRGTGGTQQAMFAATVVGLEAPATSLNLEIKPYAISSVSSDRAATPPLSNDLGGDVGLDIKYSPTENLTADLTYNTDFAQVEADEQQVNLTRFSLLLPEKREFFLDNQTIFNFGGAASALTLSNPTTADTPVLFYSRRIGFYSRRIGVEPGIAVPIDVGGRLTGRVGRYSLGILNIRSGDEPISQSRPTDFSVVRVKRDVLRRSSVGVLATNRSVGQRGTGTNQMLGVDGTFAFFTNLAFNTYWARTRTTDLSGDDTSYRTQLDYNGDRYGLQLERLVVGANFNPEVGFVRRADMHKSYGQVRFSPRPRSIRSVRKFSGIGSWTSIENGAGRLETRTVDGEFAIEFQNSDRFSVGATSSHEFLPVPFAIARSVTLPIGAIRLRQRSDWLRVRIPAKAVRNRAAGGRDVLRRSQDVAESEPGPDEPVAAALD